MFSLLFCSNLVWNLIFYVLVLCCCKEKEISSRFTIHSFTIQNTYTFLSIASIGRRLEKGEHKLYIHSYNNKKKRKIRGNFDAPMGLQAILRFGFHTFIFYSSLPFISKYARYLSQSKRSNHPFGRISQWHLSAQRQTRISCNIRFVFKALVLCNLFSPFGI